MKLSPVKTFHRAAPFRVVAKRVPPKWLFRMAQLRAKMGIALYPHTKRRAAGLVALFKAHGNNELSCRQARDAIIYNRWLNHLEYAWCNWASHHNELARVEGEDILSRVLELGNGAVLLSGHHYGFDRMVDPILAQKGYPVTRWGNPLESEESGERWGEGNYVRWPYLSFRGDAWHQMRMIRKFHEELEQNRAVHISVRGLAAGNPESFVHNNYQGFFLDTKVFALLEALQSPVLPCFALCAGNGYVVIIIYPPLGETAGEMMKEFAKLYGEFLNDRPELARFWRRVLGGDKVW